MSTSDYRRLIALEQLLIDVRHSRRPAPPNIADLRDDYRRLMAVWFALTPRERRLLQDSQDSQQ